MYHDYQHYIQRLTIRKSRIQVLATHIPGRMWLLTNNPAELCSGDTLAVSINGTSCRNINNVIIISIISYCCIMCCMSVSIYGFGIWHGFFFKKNEDSLLVFPFRCIFLCLRIIDIFTCCNQNLTYDSFSTRFFIYSYILLVTILISISIWCIRMSLFSYKRHRIHSWCQRKDHR